MFARAIQIVPLSKNGGKHGGVPIHLKRKRGNGLCRFLITAFSFIFADLF